MTEQELVKHRKWCMQKWNGNGEDIFQAACLIAIQRYGIEKVNQSLFGFLCLEAARQLQHHQKYEIPFSRLNQENQDQSDEIEFDPEDPAWEKNFQSIEEKDEIEKKYGQWLLKAVENPKPNKVTTDRTYVGKQMKFEFVA